MGPVAAMAAALAMALTGCFGTSVDPSAQFSPVDAPLAKDLADGLQGVLDQAVALSGSSGGVAGVWAPWAGEWTAASGTRDFGENPPRMTKDTGFRLATVTTEITCMVLLRLADQGEVQLDDPVSKYVDWIPKLDGITLEQLCLHTSGLADYYPVLRGSFSANPGRVWPANELLANGMALNRIGPPGEQVRESRTGVLLLALALERRTGKTWDELAQQYVFGPLGLEDTSLPPATVTEHSGVMGGYSSINTRGAVDCAVLLDDTEASSSMGGAAAGAISTLEDVRALSEAFATGALLSERTERAQWNTVPLGGDAPAWQSAGIGGLQYGPMRGTAGETAGALTAAFTDPESGLTVVVALNNSTPGQAFVREVAFALASLASKAVPAEGGEPPLIELPWSVDQATAKMQELAVCPKA